MKVRANTSGIIIFGYLNKKNMIIEFFNWHYITLDLISNFFPEPWGCR
jgi:hypothetical protein